MQFQKGFDSIVASTYPPFIFFWFVLKVGHTGRVQSLLNEVLLLLCCSNLVRDRNQVSVSIFKTKNRLQYWFRSQIIELCEFS